MSITLSTAMVFGFLIALAVYVVLYILISIVLWGLHKWRKNETLYCVNWVRDGQKYSVGPFTGPEASAYIRSISHKRYTLTPAKSS
jgi:hypothetical protein